MANKREIFNFYKYHIVLLVHDIVYNKIWVIWVILSSFWAYFKHPGNTGKTGKIVKNIQNLNFEQL